jgi:hypothetical protein
MGASSSVSATSMPDKRARPLTLAVIALAVAFAGAILFAQPNERIAPLPGSMGSIPAGPNLSHSWDCIGKGACRRLPHHDVAGQFQHVGHGVQPRL